MRRRHFLSRFGASLLGPLALLVLARPAPAQDSGVTPQLNSLTHDLMLNSTRAWWGYTNSTGSAVAIVHGSSNYFAPSNPNRGQGWRYEPGTYSNEFSVVFNTTTLTWFLDDSSATAVAASADAFVSAGNSYTLDGDKTFGSFEAQTGSTYLQTAYTFSVGNATVGDAALFHQDGGTFAGTTFSNLPGGTTRLASGTIGAATSFQNAGTLELAGGTLDTPLLANLAGGVVSIAGGTNTLPDTFTNAGTLRGAGGTLTRDAFTNAAGGTVDWEAGTFETATLTNRSTFVVEGGRVEATEAFVNDGGLRLAGGVLSTPSFTHSGFIDWQGGTLELTAGDLDTDTGGALGANPVLGAGTLHLTAGATNNAAGRTLVLTPGAELITQGGVNEGTLVVTFGTLTAASGTFTNAAGATLSATGATLTFTGDGVANGDGLQNLGTLNLIDTTIAGDVRSPAGSSVNVASGVTFTGFFSGAAAFTGGGLATFAGGYSPGDSPALVTHAGDLTLAGSNVLTMEIAGFGEGARGTLYDALDIAGTFAPGGTLAVTFLDDFDPIGGESFDFFDFGAIDGEFAGFDFPALSAGLTWNTSALYTDGVLGVTAVPEPSTYAALFGAGVLALAIYRKRRQAPAQA